MSLHCQFLHLRLFSQGESLSLERSGARNSYEWALGVNSKLKNKTKKLTKVSREGDRSSSALSVLLPEQQAAHPLDEVTVSSRHGHYEENGIRETQNGHCSFCCLSPTLPTHSPVTTDSA